MDVITVSNIVSGVIETAKVKQEEKVEGNNVYCSAITRGQKTKVTQLYQELLNKLAINQEAFEMFLNYESEVCLLESYIEEDHYISGFVDGVNHLSNITSGGKAI